MHLTLVSVKQPHAIQSVVADEPLLKDAVAGTKSELNMSFRCRL